jgi:4-amino-4-deoxy-L-arabinose transferase-like glycosyltransferase
MKKYLISLSIITLIGLFLRVYRLADRPLGFTWDEASLGYNAFSLLKTARDEYGQLLPVIFKSFGDYKPGAYIYFTVLPVKLFGLNELATRIPSAVFGTLLIPVLFLLVRYLFPQSKAGALCSSLILALNPWALQFSRGAWEANLNLLFTVIAALLFIRKKYFLSAFFFGLTFWTYQGAKLFTPLLVIGLFLIFRPRIPLKKLSLFLLSVFCFLLPVIIGFSSQSGRLKVFSVFSYTRSPKEVQSVLSQDRLTRPDLLFYLFHAEIIDQLRGVYLRYLNHLSPRFLFINGNWTSLRESVYGYGNFHMPEILTLAMGFIFLAVNIKNPSVKFLFLWIALAPLPSALSRDSVSAVRSLPLLIPLIIISGIGLARILNRKILIIPYSLLTIFLFIYYLDLYYIHSPYYSAVEWLYPYKPAIQLIKPKISDYSQVYFTDKLGQPYIFFLFYLHIDPARYQRQARLTLNPNGDVGQNSGFDKYSFRPIFWPQLRGQIDAIFVGDEYELPEKDLQINNLQRLGDINYPSGQIALRAVAIK